MLKSVQKRFGLILTIIVLAVAVVPAASSEDLPKFHRVNDLIYRGAQPSREGLKKLAAIGIRSVVNLRGSSEDVLNERREAEDLGLRYLNVGLPAFGKPSKDSVAAILKFLTDPQNAPIFIHCKYGEDRTGTIVACYRVLRDGWSVENALSEAKALGMNRIQVGMRDFIKEFARITATEKKKAAAAAQK